jgi:hypothetical protein
MLWNLKPHHRMLILGQINSVHTTPFYYLQDKFHYFHPSTSWSFVWSLSFRISTKILYESPHACYSPCSRYPPLGPNILPSALFSNTLSLCSTLNVRSHVSHPYRTTGKIIIFFRSQIRRQKFPHRLVASISRIEPPLYFLKHNLLFFTNI